MMREYHVQFCESLWWKFPGATHLSFFFGNADDAAYMRVLLSARLAEFGLSLSETKTHQTYLGKRSNSETHERRRMTFLGFTIYRAKTRKGTGSKTVFQTEAKRYGRAKAAIKQKIRMIKHWPIEKQVEMINASLRGHFDYYGFAGNGRKLNNFWYQVKRDWKHSLSKRSQKSRINWEKFQGILRQNPLVAPKIRISYLKLHEFVRL